MSSNKKQHKPPVRQSADLPDSTEQESVYITASMSLQEIMDVANMVRDQRNAMEEKQKSGE